MRGAPITIKCHCGQLERIPYGETWACPGCGRTWNTNQIPADEYWGIMRRMKTSRLRVMALGLTIAAAAVVAAVLYQPIVVLLIPVMFSFWQIWYMPMWRRRLRRETRSLPGWRLKPD